jgi:hypothetical protein
MVPGRSLVSPRIVAQSSFLDKVKEEQDRILFEKCAALLNQER